MKGNYFKYLTASKPDKEWGLYLKVAGFTENPPYAPYPLIQHPSGYHFTWQKGRTLDEFQISYITKGKGVLEISGKTHVIKAGMAFIIFPGQWHRYKPDISTGWNEYYIGFQGAYASVICNQPVFRFNGSVFDIGHNITILSSFDDILVKVKSEHPGYQQQAAGRVVSILGEILATVKNQDFSGREIEKLIKMAQFEIRERLSQSINFESFAEKYHVSYSYFRRMFKIYTGLSPAQYHLQLRLHKARDLICTTDLSMKEITFNLGFESQFHFSKIFKKKFGVAPKHFKERRDLEIP